MLRLDAQQTVSRRTILVRTASAAGAFVATQLLAACGGSVSPTATSGGATSAGPTATSVTAGTITSTVAPAVTGNSQVALRVWAAPNKAYGDMVDSLAQKFNASQPSIKATVELIAASGNVGYSAKYTTAFSTKTEADVLLLHGHDAQQFVESGVLEPLTPTLFTAAAARDRFFNEVLDPFVSGDKIYGMPGGNNTPGIGMIINLDHAAQAGITVPEKFDSWAQVWDMAGKLTKKDSSGNVTRAGLNVKETHQLQYVCGFILEQGGKYFDEQTGKFSFNTPEGKAALQVFYDAIYTYKVDSTDIPLILDGSKDALASELCSMGMMWIDYLSVAASQGNGSRFGFIVRPPLAGNNLIVAGEAGWSTCISVNSKNKQAAFEFLRFVNQDENMLQWNQKVQSLPAVKTLVDSPYFKSADAKWLQGALKVQGNEVYEGRVGYLSKLNADIGWTAMVDMLNKKITVDQCAARIDKEASDMFAQYRKDVSQNK